MGRITRYTAMLKLMAVVYKHYPGAVLHEVVDMFGSSTSTISRCKRGAGVSAPVAAQIAKRYGGKCKAWADEVEYVVREKIGLRQESYQGDALRQITHKLTPIDIDDIRCPLPVIHPQPVYLGKPLWSI